WHPPAGRGTRYTRRPMRTLGRLLASVVAIAVGQGLATWWILLAVFPLARGEESLLRGALVAGTALEAAILAAAMAWLARPLSAALAPGAEGDERLLHAAESAAHALALRVCALVGAGGLAVAAVVITALRERGLADDLAAAAAAVALAVAIVAAML